jgi:hypothetical protein
MLFLWGFCSVIGVLIARYCRHKTWWLYAHVSAQMFAFLCTLPSAIVAAYSSSLQYKDGTIEAQLAGSYNEAPTSSVAKAHLNIGPIITCLTILQGYLGKYRLHDLKLPFDSCAIVTLTRTNMQSIKIGTVHRILGKLLLSLAMAQMYLGCSLLFHSNSVARTFITYLAMLLCIFAGLEIFVLPKNEPIPIDDIRNHAKDIEYIVHKRVADCLHPCFAYGVIAALDFGFQRNHQKQRALGADLGASEGEDNEL